MSRRGLPCIRRRWQQIRALPPDDRRLLAEAVTGLALGRLAVRATPFHVLARRLGRHMNETGPDDVADQATLWRMAWALRFASAHLPWRCECLEQAIAAKLMLRRRDIPNTLYLGAARTDGGMEAHAWVRIGAFVLTGADGRERFAVVSTFADQA